MLSISLGTTSFLGQTGKHCLEFRLCTPEKNTNTANCTTVRRFTAEVGNILSYQEGIDDFCPVSWFNETGASLELSTQSKRINEIMMDMIFLKRQYRNYTYRNQTLISKMEFQKWKSTILTFTPEKAHELAKELLQQKLISREYYENFVSNPFPSLYQLSLDSVFGALGNPLPPIETLPLPQKIKKDLFELSNVPKVPSIALSAQGFACLDLQEYENY